MSIRAWRAAMVRWIAAPPTVAGDAILALALTATGAALAGGLYAPLGDTRLAMVMLLPVLFAGLLGGLRAALIAAAAAYLAYTFIFLPPAMSLKVERAGDMLTLAVFLAAAVVAGVGPGLLRDEQRRAAARSGRMLAIIESNDFFTVTPNEDAIRTRLAEAVAAIARSGAVVTDAAGAVVHRAGRAEAWVGGVEGEIATLARLAMARAGASAVILGAFRARAVRLNGEAIGAVVWLSPVDGAATVREADEHIGLLADLAGVAIGRVRRHQESP